MKFVTDLNNPTNDELKNLSLALKKYRETKDIIPMLTSFALICNIPVEYLEEYIKQDENMEYEYRMMMTKYHNEILKGVLGQQKINPMGAQFILETKFGYSKKEKEQKSSIYSNMSDEELGMQLERARGELNNEKK